MSTAPDRDTLLGQDGDPAFFVHRSGYDLMVALRRTQHRIEVSIDHALADLGMTYAQYRTLTHLAGAPFAIDISELARRLRVTRQSAHACVEKLHLQDLVEVDHDGYRATIHVTDHGRADSPAAVTRPRDLSPSSIRHSPPSGAPTSSP